MLHKKTIMPSLPLEDSPRKMAVVGIGDRWAQIKRLGEILPLLIAEDYRDVYVRVDASKTTIRRAPPESSSFSHVSDSEN